jgi:hypothetical protein
MKYFSILLMSFFALIPYVAFAEQIPVQIKPLNDIDMIIFGTVHNSGDNPVAILIKNQSGDLILVAQVTPDDKGNFSLNVTKHGPLWHNTKEFHVTALVPDPQATQTTEQKSYREGTESDSNIVINEDGSSTVDFQALVASQAKCTVLGFSGLEACSLQSSLTLGITTTAIIGVIIAVSVITLRRSNQNNL